MPDEAGVPADPVLKRPYFGWHRFEWPDDDSIEFHLTHGDWIRILRANGFEIEDPIEIQARGCSDPGRLRQRGLRQRGLGPALAERGDLEGPQRG